MKITTNTIEEFLYCLEDEDVIFDDSIRLSLARIPTNEKEKNPIVFDVTAQVGAILCVGEDNLYLLEAVEYCGTDYEDAKPVMSGSERAHEINDLVQGYAEKRNWKVKPGVITHQ